MDRAGSPALAEPLANVLDMADNYIACGEWDPDSKYALDALAVARAVLTGHHTHPAGGDT